MEVKIKRSFPFNEDFVANNKVKKLKIHNQISSDIIDMSGHNFIKHSTVQPSETLKRISLAERMVPMNIEAYVGQKQIIGPDTVLNYLLEKGEIPSMIFWGPPGCGKVKLVLFSIFVELFYNSYDIYDHLQFMF